MYHAKSSYAGVMDEDTFSPVGLELPPIAGYGTLTLPAMSGYHGFGNPASPAVPVVQASPPPPPSGGPVPPQGQPVQLGKGAALLIGGLVLAGVGIIGYFAYQELQLRKKIVEKGGGEALAKYELGRAAGTAASALFGSSAQPNRRKRRAKRNGNIQDDKLAFLRLSSSRQSALRRAAKRYMRQHPSMSHAGGFWRTLSADHVSRLR